MLILQRKEGESIQIGDEIEVRVVEIGNGIVKIAIDATKDIQIFRSELLAASDVNKEVIEQTADLDALKHFVKTSKLAKK